MADFSVKVWRINEPVINHPNADRLTIVKIGGYECIANKHPDGSFRYQEGDYVVYIPEAAVLPEWLLKKQDMWDEANNKGFLAGAQGNRVKAIKLRGIVSQGIMYAVEHGWDEPMADETVGKEWLAVEIPNEDGSFDLVEINPLDDLAELFSIVKYEPPIPTHLSGEVCAIFGKPVKYDFENLKSVPDIFVETDLVVATEKLHGTFCQIGMIPGFSHPELFGTEQNIYVCSKGLGSQGFVFKNNDGNRGNLYVKALLTLLDNGLEANMKLWSEEHDNLPFRLFGEVYGRGVQDLHYGLTAPEFAAFDMMGGNDFISAFDFDCLAALWKIPTVPQLYHGKFDHNALVKLRDGKTILGGANVREGLVVKEAYNNRHEAHGRKIAKMVSPDYLLRKGKATEFN